jgi:hypothetical protein
MAILNELARLLFVLPEAQADLLRFLLPGFLEEYDVFAARPLDTQFVITTDEAGTRTELRLDLLFLAPSRTPGKSPALLHMEPQQGGWLEFQVRMDCYNRMIRGTFPKWPLLSIGTTTTHTGGILGRSPVQRETLGGWLAQEFWFLHFPVGDLKAVEYVASDNALVQAHRANMRWPRRVRKVERLLEIFRALQRLTLPGVYRQRLMWWTEASLELTPVQQAEAQALWQAEIGEEEMERTFVSMFEREALARGLEQGREQGLTRGQQKILLTQLRRKFGEVPVEAEDRLRQITDPDALDHLAVRLIEASSLADLGLTAAQAA